MKKYIREYLLTKEGIALISVLFSLLAYYWITYYVGFLPPAVNARLFNPIDFMMPNLLFIVPATLGLALKKITGLLIAIPYLIWLGLGLVGVLFLAGDPFSETVAINRANATFIVACAVPAMLIALLRTIGKMSQKVYLAALLVHLALLAGAVYYYTYHYGAWHLAGEPVSIQRVRLSRGEISFPLVEKDAAYLVDRNGRLYQVTLATGRKRLLAQIPRPTAAEAGFPEMLLPPIDRYNSPFNGVLTRINNNELSFRYNYHLIRRIEHDYGHGYGDGGSFTMEVRINQKSSQVSWQLKGNEHKAPVELPRPDHNTVAQERLIRVAPDQGIDPFTVLIEGEGIRTVIDPMGWVEWAQAQHGWILVGTDRGDLLIVTTTEKHF